MNTIHPQLETRFRERHRLAISKGDLADSQLGKMMKTRPLRVLYLDNTSTFGGAIRSMSSLVRGLTPQRVDATIVSGQPLEVLRRLFPDSDCLSYSPGHPWSRMGVEDDWQSVNGFCLLQKLRKHQRTLHRLLRRDFLGAIRLAAIGREYQVDLVHTNNETNSQLNGLLAAKLLKVPSVAHHRSLQNDRGRSARFNASLPDGHIAISRAVRDSLLPIVPPIKPVWLVHNGVHLKDFAPRPPKPNLRSELGMPDDVPIVSHFGRIVEWKGQLEFLRGLATIVDKHPFHGLIVGDSSGNSPGYEQLVRDSIETFGLRGAVSLVGHRHDVSDIMNLSEVVVHTSIRPEPFGRVIIEAMATGRPVIAANAGGPLDIIRHDIDGLLVDPLNAEELGQAILTLLSDKPFRQRLGRAGLQRVQARFSEESCADAVMATYCSLLAVARV